MCMFCMLACLLACFFCRSFIHAERQMSGISWEAHRHHHHHHHHKVDAFQMGHHFAFCQRTSAWAFKPLFYLIMPKVYTNSEWCLHSNRKGCAIQQATIESNQQDKFIIMNLYLCIVCDGRKSSLVSWFTCTCRWFWWNVYVQVQTDFSPFHDLLTFGRQFMPFICFQVFFRVVFFFVEWKRWVRHLIRNLLLTLWMVFLRIFCGIFLPYLGGCLLFTYFFFLLSSGTLFRANTTSWFVFCFRLRLRFHFWSGFPGISIVLLEHLIFGKNIGSIS